MNYRLTKLLAETNLSTAGTKSIDIAVADIISRIDLSWRVTKSKHGMDSYAHKDITKIELVDGSEVLHSLDGGQNQALCIYDRKCNTMSHGQHVSGSAEFSTFGIDFGRYLFDPALAFDPKKFRNPQLKVTFNFATADTGATSGNLEVLAHCFDEKVVSPVGILVAKEFYNYTPGAENSYEYIDLPTDQVIRKMLLQGYRSGYEPWSSLKEARLSEDNDKRVPFDEDLEFYFRRMKGVWKPVLEDFYGYAQPTTGYTFYITPTDYYAHLMGMPQTTVCLTIMGMPGGKVTITSATNPDIFLGSASGWLPNHCFELPFGDDQDMADWYDVTKIGSLRLRLKSGASGTSGGGRVVIQQVRKY